MSEWLKSVLSGPYGPSTKRHIVSTSAAVLCLVSICLGLSCAVWVWKHGDLGAGAVGALTFALGILAGLAGNAYRKPDGVSAPPAREPSDCVGLSLSAGDKTSPGGRKDGQK